jgi:hypothetical protein
VVCRRGFLGGWVSKRKQAVVFRRDVVLEGELKDVEYAVMETFRYLLAYSSHDSYFFNVKCVYFRAEKFVW